jgi:peptide deformylase
MKTTLIVIQHETDHADAKRLVEKLIEDPLVFGVRA